MVVSLRTGAVSILPSGRDRWLSNPKLPFPLQAGDRVRTGGGSTARLMFGRDAVVVGPGSDLRVVGAGPDERGLELSSGTLRGSFVSGTWTVEIFYQGNRLMPQWGDFQLSAARGAARAQVLTGRLLVDTASGGRRLLSAGESLELRPGSVSAETVAPAPKPAPKPAPSPEDLVRAEAYYSRGLRFYLRGDPERAMDDWKRALRLNSKHEKAVKAMARVLKETSLGGKRQEAHEKSSDHR